MSERSLGGHARSKFAMPVTKLTKITMPVTTFTMSLTKFTMPVTKFTMSVTIFYYALSNFPAGTTRSGGRCTSGIEPCHTWRKFTMPVTTCAMPLTKFTMPVTKFTFSVTIFYYALSNLPPGTTRSGGRCTSGIERSRISRMWPSTRRTSFSAPAR